MRQASNWRKLWSILLAAAMILSLVAVTTQAADDTTPPEWADGYPNLSTTGDKHVTLHLRSNEAGKAYYVRLDDGAGAPSAQQVKEGRDSNGNQLSYPAAYWIDIMADMQHALNVKQLAPNTQYDIYLVLEDGAGNLQESPACVSVTTTLPDPDKSSISQTPMAAGSKQVRVDVTVRNAAAVPSKGYQATEFSVEVDGDLKTFAEAPFSGFSDPDNGTYNVYFTGEDHGKAYQLTNLTVAGVVIVPGPVTLTTPLLAFLPTVVTGPVTAVTSAEVWLSGTVTADGGAAVNEFGYVYSTTANPVIDGPGVTRMTLGNDYTGPFDIHISGLTAERTYYVRAYAHNSAGFGYGADVSFTTLPEGTPPNITTESLPNGTVGATYSQNLAADGDTPIVWSIDSGSLPDGLNLAGDTISGTPSAGGTFNFTIKAENSSGSDTKALSITINPAAPETYTITAAAGSGGTINPDGSVAVTAGSSQAFTITPATGNRIKSVLVDGVDQGAISTYTFTNVTADHTISATFEPADDGGDYTARTLTDNPSGITVTGSVIHKDAVLTVQNMTLHGAGYDSACDAIREYMKDKNYSYILGQDISLSHGFTGTLTITIPLGSQYNGKTVTILHCKNGILATYSAKVTDGKATFIVTSLSPFAVFTATEKKTTPAAMPKTGNSGSLPLALGLALSALGLGTLATSSRRRKKGWS